MYETKVIFVAFASEDKSKRDILKARRLNTASQVSYIDVLLKYPNEPRWQDKVRSRIRRSDGVIMLISKNTQLSICQTFEITCAKEEKKNILGVWAYDDDHTEIPDINTIDWEWNRIQDFFDTIGQPCVRVIK